MEKKEKITFSTHHFIFAFRWDFLQKGKLVKDINFDKRTSFKNIDTLLKKNEYWQRKNKIEYKDFNFFTYFYNFVRDSVYDTEKENEIVRYYEYDIEKYISKDNTNKKEYIITYLDDDFKISKLNNENDKEEDKDKNKSKDKYNEKYIKKYTKTLTLNVNGITLFLLNTGVGIISFDLSNTKEKQSSPESILKINEFGRRIYPQFLNFDNKNKIINAQSVFHPLSVKLFDWEENFNSYNENEKFSTDNPIELPVYITKLFNEINYVKNEREKINENRVRIKLITDDRMFFVSWYGNDAFSLKTGKSYKNNNWWYSYIFGDKKNPSIANEEMKEEQIRLHTYQRWSDYGTLYGMSRDSFVCISSSEEYIKKENLPNFKNTSKFNLLSNCCFMSCSKSIGFKIFG